MRNVKKKIQNTEQLLKKKQKKTPQHTQPEPQSKKLSLTDKAATWDPASTLSAIKAPIQTPPPIQSLTAHPSLWLPETQRQRQSVVQK